MSEETVAEAWANVKRALWAVWRSPLTRMVDRLTRILRGRR